MYGDLLTNNAGFPQFFQTGPKASPNLAGGVLWADDVNGKFYAFGGYFPTGTPTRFDTWVFNDVEGSWSTEEMHGDSMAYVAHGMSAVAPDAGMAYYLGGYKDKQTHEGWPTSRTYMSQLITFNMLTGEYSNHSGPDNFGRGEGHMAFIPASWAGVLVYFGGVMQDPATGVISGVSTLGPPSFFLSV